MAFALRTRLSLKNKRNGKILAEQSSEKERSADNSTTEEIWDNDPRYVFMT